MKKPLTAIVGVLAVAASASLASAAPGQGTAAFSAPAGTLGAATPSGGDGRPATCTATYQQGATWAGGYLGTVAVTNRAASRLSGWSVQLALPRGQSVVAVWSSTASASRGTVTVTNAPHNGGIAPNGTQVFGFVAAGNGTGRPRVLDCTASASGTAPSWSPSTSLPNAADSPAPVPSTGPAPVPSTGAPTPSGRFSNPVLWEDFADADVFRVDDTYYYSASNMHYSPGAPVMRSYDLVHWEMAGHSVPRLDFSPAYDLNPGRAYIKGTWASFLNYRKSNKTFYWGGCIEFNKTYIYTAPSVEGPWQKHPAINNCYYDAGLLIDDDDTMYVAYGNTTIHVAQLSKDGFSQVRTQKVYDSPADVGTIEGSRFYKVNGNYYIFVTHPADGEYVLRSTSGPFGPYTMQPTPFLKGLRGPIPGGGVPHQGGIVQTQNGDWYYMAFVDAYPGGRVPVLAPITWGTDGWPALRLVDGAWGASYPAPAVPRPPREVKPPTGVDTFSGSALGPEWEWNHNPDDTKWSLSGGLNLATATVTDDLYSARNTLTRRILGPSSTATISLDVSGMKDGDRAGLAMLRDSSAWIGVKRDGGGTRLAMVSNITMDRKWNTTSTGTEVAGAPLAGGRVWLRVTADIRPGAGRRAAFSYSTDGTNFTSLGTGFTLGNSWEFFPGYRFAVFNYATQALGGTVKVGSFTLTSP
jgi:beta-xylosidase